MGQVKHNLYVGCGLTHAPDYFRESVEKIKRRLTLKWNIMQFLGLERGGPRDVYKRDIEENIRGCDAFLAIVDHPSTGLGWELGVADERKIPTLIVAHDASLVSNLLAGASELRDRVRFQRYSDPEEIPHLVEQHLRPMIELGRRMEEK